MKVKLPVLLFLVFFCTVFSHEFDTSTKKILQVQDDTFNAIFKFLTPLKIEGYSKVRLGKDYDGGYVVPTELLDKIERCYTYGAGDDISFEIDLIKAKSNINVRIYDHTVNYPGRMCDKLFFKKEGLGLKKTDKLDTLFNHLNENNDLDKKIILKIDIEGSEWPVLEDIDLEILRRDVVIFVVEFHWFSNFKNTLEYKNVLEKLSRIFKVFHVHGNNYSSYFYVNNKLFPDVIEITYINNDYVSSCLPLETLVPLNIDMPNCPKRPDYQLNYWYDEL